MCERGARNEIAHLANHAFGQCSRCGRWNLTPFCEYAGMSGPSRRARASAPSHASSLRKQGPITTCRGFAEHGSHRAQREAAAYGSPLSRGRQRWGRVDCPTGKSAHAIGRFPCPDPRAKIFLFFRITKSAYIHSIPRHQRGASRSSRTRRGLRWTRIALETKACEADGEIVWFRRLDAGVKSATMLRIALATVARKPDRREEHV